MKKNKKTKILCITDTDRGRDIELVMPVCYFAEKYLNCHVEYAFAWDVFSIYRKKPDIVLIPNAIGSLYYFYTAKYAIQNGARVFALVSEGNFWTNESHNFWGANKDKKIFHDYYCLWSQRAVDFYKKIHPEFNKKYKLTGGTIFDKYKFQSFTPKEDFLKKYNIHNYKKVIGYAGWSFGKLYNKLTIKDHRYVRAGDPNRIEWMKKFKEKVEKILKETIEKNPDILFVLKKHPKETRESDHSKVINETEELKNYKNVLFLNKNENIDEIISACDIWTGFETTTALQAWLLDNKPTVLLGTHIDFFRDKLYEGSLIVNNSLEFQAVIDEYYNTGKINVFESEINAKREEQIKATIGFKDGCNHIRVCHYLNKTIQDYYLNNDTRSKFSVKFFIWYIFYYFMKPFYNKKLFLKIPKFKKTTWIFDNYNRNKIIKLRDEFYEQLNVFYKIKLDNEIENNDLLNKIIQK